MLFRSHLRAKALDGGFGQTQGTLGGNALHRCVEMCIRDSYMNNWLNQLERKYGRFGIPNLTNILVGGQILVLAIELFVNQTRCV